MTGRWPHGRCCDLVDAEVSAFVETVRGADPATPVPTCGRHRPVIDPEVAVDGVDEVLALITRARRFRPEVGRLRGAGDRLRLLAADGTDEWTVTLTERGYDWTAGPVVGAAPREVAVRAPAADLYLMLWRRLPPAGPDFDVTGDRRLLDFWLENSAI